MSKRKFMDAVDLLIERILKKAGEPLSTYDIAKRTSLSWSTVNTHLYKLQVLGIVEGKVQPKSIAQRRRKVWWLKKSK